MGDDLDLRRLLILLLLGDPAAADELDRLGDKLKEKAAQLRAEQAPRSTGGMGDRVQMRLVGPDGTVKQVVDTNPTG